MDNNSQNSDIFSDGEDYGDNAVNVSFTKFTKLIRY